MVMKCYCRCCGGQVLHAKRKLLLQFRGGLTAILRDEHGKRVRHPHKLRRWLAKLLRRQPGVLYSGYKTTNYQKAPRYTPRCDEMHRRRTEAARPSQEIDSSTFCLLPRGNTPWTQRFFDAVVRG